MTASNSPKILLRWRDPGTGRDRELSLTLPIAIGKAATHLPAELDGSTAFPLVLDDPQVSRFHAAIAWRGGQIVLEDRGSTNGTYVNGARVSQQHLQSGDRVRVGSHDFEVSLPGQPPLAPQASIPTAMATTSTPMPTVGAGMERGGGSGSPALRLRWEDPTTGEARLVECQLPIVLGRDPASMPDAVAGLPVAKIVFDSLQVSRYHAAIALQNGQIWLSDRNSTGGTYVNGRRERSCPLRMGDMVGIGPYAIAIAPALQPTVLPVTILPTVPSTIALEADPNAPPPATNDPIAAIVQAKQVSVQQLHATGAHVCETTYAAIGGGLGSYIWADCLRVCGVAVDRIVAIGLEPVPYARYQRLCQNSQIPPHERLRSNSDSCPDNLWGWPSYALREAWRELQAGQLGTAARILWQVFAEPTFAETYTPRSGNVFAAIDREAQRIGWNRMFRYGRVRAIRQTDDGRYAIAYTMGRGERAFVVAPYVHLAVGYAAIQFLPELQDYRTRTGDRQSVVNAYEAHEHVYQHLERQGGTVMLRGRGIVASRIVQRLAEVRRCNSNVGLLHLMRSPRSQGNRFGRAQRRVEHHYEFQPFNWPKACWGGDLRALLERSDPHKRKELLADWGGTTTANRRDWRRIVDEGIRAGWYQITFGEVVSVEKQGNKTLTCVRTQGVRGELRLEADFIIDATGLDAKVEANPLLADLVSCYDLPLNVLGRLQVANDFEVTGLRNGQGRVYAAGAVTLGGPHAAVDSFLGLQYAALRSVDSLAAARAPQVRYLNGLASLQQWWKWAMGVAP